MRPVHHVMISGGVSVLFGFWAQNFSAIVTCFISGILIDLDHHLDYWLHRKEFPLSYKKLIDFLENDHDSRLHLFFHSYELIALLWVYVLFFDAGAVWLGLAVGVTTHLICDEIYNPLRPLSYFLIYRMKYKFDRKMFFKPGDRHAAA